MSAVVKNPYYRAVHVVNVSPKPASSRKTNRPYFRKKFYLPEMFYFLYPFGDEKSSDIRPVLVNEDVWNYPEEYELAGLIIFKRDPDEPFEIVPQFLHGEIGVQQNPNYIQLMNRINRDTDWLHNAVHFETESRIIETPPTIERVYIQPDWRKVMLWTTLVSALFLFAVLALVTRMVL